MRGHRTLPLEVRYVGFKLFPCIFPFKFYVQELNNVMWTYCLKEALFSHFSFHVKYFELTVFIS